MLLTLTVAASCTHTAATPRPSRSLSVDSMILLHQALRHVRPGFTTQEEAVRAGVYHHLNVATAVDEVREPPRASAPSSAGPREGFVVQIAAYRERALAERAAAEAQRRFPRTIAMVEASDDMFRVTLTGWQSAPAATAELPEIQRVYPGAWVRRAGVS